jgi:hypothetical protein
MSGTTVIIIVVVLLLIFGSGGRVTGGGCRIRKVRNTPRPKINPRPQRKRDNN